ncbi:hypothetical protein GQ457_01G022640 [Hibiscus cannabinus]
MQGAKLNPSLISALVERSRPETHTFHLPSGEATIMLQDVAYQFGLPIEGHVITGTAEDNWFLLGRELLGVDLVDLDGSRVHITWLNQNFSNLSANASTLIKEQFASVHILRVIGGILVPDKSRNKVHLMWLRHLRDLSKARKFSWESAMLAYLFRGLCRATDPSGALCCRTLDCPTVSGIFDYSSTKMMRYSRRPPCEPIETYSITYDYFDWCEANGKPHILTPVERQREIYARPKTGHQFTILVEPQPAAPRRTRGNNTGESSSVPPQPQPPVADSSTPIAPQAISAFQHIGSPSEGFFTDIVHPFMPMSSGTSVGPSQATGTATVDDDEDEEPTKEEELIPR